MSESKDKQDMSDLIHYLSNKQTITSEDVWKEGLQELSELKGVQFLKCTSDLSKASPIQSKPVVCILPDGKIVLVDMPPSTDDKPPSSTDDKSK
jgi:hypothetical protein